MTRVPAADIMAIHDAIAGAMKAVENDDFALWSKLVHARSVVQVYLVQKLLPLDVEITP